MSQQNEIKDFDGLDEKQPDQNKDNSGVWVLAIFVVLFSVVIGLGFMSQ